MSRMLDLTRDVQKALHGVPGITKLFPSAPGWGRGKKKLRLKGNGQPNHLIVEVAEPEGKQDVHIYTSAAHEMNAVREHIKKFASKAGIPLLA